MRRLRWDPAPRKLPAHPYRDSAIVYAVLAGVLVGVTALTGGNVRTAAIVAPALFVAATAYSWWRWRERIRQREREAE
jgi:membrane protein implicated in regulation of membrane protease activity